MCSDANVLCQAAGGWIQVPPPALQGQGLKPYREGEIRNLFDWAEDLSAGSAHLMPHRGQFIVDVVAIEKNAVHQPSKPGDELVVVLNGTLTLTDDSDRREQVIRAGEMVLIPAGWAGLYRVHAEKGVFRELAVVPGDYFDPETPSLPSGLSPRRLELPSAVGEHLLHRKRYGLALHNLDRPTDRAVSGSTDEVVLVLAGTLTLASMSETESFDAGSVLVIPRGFSGRIRAQPGYRGMHASWIG